MSKKRRTWPWIVLGVCILLVFIGIGAVIATTAWVQQNLTVTETSEGGAQKEFDVVKARFASRPPLLEFRDGRPVLTGGTAPPAPSDAGLVEHLYVLAWDPDEGRLANVSVPFWLLRLKSGPIRFSSYAAGWDDDGVKLTAEDIQKHGPGIILDMTSPRGERVLLWAQ
jgi:hypothetical protein